MAACEDRLATVYCRCLDKGEERMRRKAREIWWNQELILKHSGWQLHGCSTRKQERISNGALGFLLGLGLGDKQLCLGLRRSKRRLQPPRFPLALISLTRQISRLETRIKECIRVESIVVKKPIMRNESKYDRRGAEPWHIVPVRIFLKDLSEINSDTTRKMMILTRRG